MATFLLFDSIDWYAQTQCLGFALMASTVFQYCGILVLFVATSSHWNSVLDLLKTYQMRLKFKTEAADLAHMLFRSCTQSGCRQASISVSLWCNFDKQTHGLVDTHVATQSLVNDVLESIFINWELNTFTICTHESEYRNEQCAIVCNEVLTSSHVVQHQALLV